MKMSEGLGGYLEDDRPVKLNSIWSREKTGEIRENVSKVFSGSIWRKKP
jgi:hypothetical protein